MLNLLEGVLQSTKTHEYINVSMITKKKTSVEDCPQPHIIHWNIQKEAKRFVKTEPC